MNVRLLNNEKILVELMKLINDNVHGDHVCRNNIKVNSQMRLPYFDYTKYTDMEIIDKVKMLLLFS